ncbi:MAG: putative rane protein [Gemmatimonadetes bacterium]|jgi:L,D-peptidoglycan transpeptidase YkuD (ErfK/YbiS/YcfS/YnhG family)|nr:putative rane protein [Gemmatimonadota bacterium]
MRGRITGGARRATHPAAVPAMLLLALLLAGSGCARAPRPVATEGTPPRQPSAIPPVRDLAPPGVTQLVIVSGSGWDSTGGTLRRYERADARAPWVAVGGAVPVVVGRNGLAWDARSAPAGTANVKREGDGRAPAGTFTLDMAFGFAPNAEMRWLRIPYMHLTPDTECVDDVASVHYNRIVRREGVPGVDWNSSERMRAIEQYRLGVLVGYNAAPPQPGVGSCIFLHVWAGPGTSTAGCTAMAERDLRELLLWLRRERQPMLVQLPASEWARLGPRIGVR